MRRYSSPLLVTPNFQNEEYIRITPEPAGWDYLHFAARQLRGGEKWEFEIGENGLEGKKPASTAGNDVYEE